MTLARPPLCLATAGPDGSGKSDHSGGEVDDRVIDALPDSVTEDDDTAAARPGVQIIPAVRPCYEVAAMAVMSSFW
jgi:hypothetical protein